MIYSLPVTGVFVTNCYFDIDEETGHGFLIDPGAEGKKLAGIIRQKGWTIEKILLTHGHFDHWGGVNELQKQFDIPVMIHENGKAFLSDTRLNLSKFCRVDMTLEGAGTFRDGDMISLNDGNITLKVLHTPGHTVDSVVLYNKSEGAAFVGDTIFQGAVGGTDYPTSDSRQLFRSIREKILTLPGETALLSGHSEVTTVGEEQRFY